jgi:Rrf2 family iron-sulfur cluster assembly transcriptional regulator
MKLSTKGRYAMLALVDLVLNGSGRLVTLVEISERQDISLAYLEQLFVKLRRAGIVDSVRGPSGGYKLASVPDKVRISEILYAVDEGMNALSRGAGASGATVETKAHQLTDQLWNSYRLMFMCFCIKLDYQIFCLIRWYLVQQCLHLLNWLMNE